MATINNSEIMKRIAEDAKIEQAYDKLPTQLAEKVVPVLISNPKYNLKVASGTVSDSTDGTILTCSSSKKTYFVAGYVNISKDVANDAIYTWLRCTPKGQAANQVCLNIRYEPTVATSNISGAFVPPIPILLEKGTTINLSNSSATASIDAGCSVVYFEVEE